MLKITKVANNGAIHFKTDKGYFFAVPGEYDSVASFYEKKDGRYNHIGGVFARLPYMKRKGQINNTKKRLDSMREILQWYEEETGHALL